MVAWMFFSFGTQYFLQFWTTEHDNPKDIKNFVLIYVLLNLGVTVTDFMRMFILLMGNLVLSREVNFLMTFRLLHASINKFFDRIPIGRILNRFLRDSDMMDNMLGWGLSFLVQVIFMCIVDFGVLIFTSSPLIIPFFLLYVLLSFRVQRRYQCLQRDITRLRSITSSPMIQSFSEGVQGNSTIRAFNKQTYALQEYTKHLDEFQKNSLTGDACGRWFTIRLTLLCNFVIIPSLFLAVFYLGTSAGKFALLIRYLLFTISDVDNLLDTAASFENRIISLERCLYFVGVEPEVGYRSLDKLESKMRDGYSAQVVKSKYWPTGGDISIKDLRVKYRPDLPDVLKGISLHVEHGTKVGIVGRTGAGKTTFINTLFRNFDDYEGEIIFSGRELREIDLKVLRSNMTIIPQDPYIFQSTLRVNLDPLKERSDEEIVSLLKEVRLWDKFAKDKELESEIEQGGSNLSQGEKQLLCLARALLNHNKLIIMDEATANIDSQTEVVIQELLKEKFVDCTIFMIAHRLNTILHCDKVLVLDQGNIVEFGDLNELANDPASHFGAMLTKSDELAQNLG
jgi:ATP-binding cassette subfamily C (CFTR/MRP) protein 2